jgi:predicted lipoprotein with Yx(FWY)xxD motif
MLRKLVPWVLALVLLGVLASAALADKHMPAVGVRYDSPLGQILTDPAGKTLYIWDRDEMGVSNCYDQCATNWPPLTTMVDPMGMMMEGPISVLTRRDGSRQWAWNGQPLYYYARDTEPGDTTGQGVGGTWWVVKFEGMMMSPGM